MDLVLVGADRIAANGDVPIKIWEYGLLAYWHGAQTPFYVAAPVSTIDLNRLRERRFPWKSASQRR